MVEKRNEITVEDRKEIMDCLRKIYAKNKELMNRIFKNNKPEFYLSSLSEMLDDEELYIYPNKISLATKIKANVNKCLQDKLEQFQKKKIK